MNPKKQKKVYVTILLFNLYSIWVHVESQIYELNCLKTLKSSEFAKKKKKVVKNPLCLFHHVLTTIQLIFKNRETKKGCTKKTIENVLKE